MPAPGGFILVARKTLENEVLMEGPSLYMKLWVWMLLQANWRDRDKLKRGQFVASIKDMQKAMAWKIGYRTHYPTKAEIRSAYEAFTNNTMINRTKSTRGMIITICNYEYYQDMLNYEPHNEQHNEDSTNNTVATHDTERRGKKERRKEKNNTDFALPDWMPEALWSRFLVHRKSKKCPVDKKQYHGFVSRFDKLRGQGYSPEYVISTIEERGWAWFKPEWVGGKQEAKEEQWITVKEEGV